MNFDEVDHADDDYLDDGAKDTSTIDADYTKEMDPSNNTDHYAETIKMALSCGLTDRQTMKLINSVLIDLKIKDRYVSTGKIRYQKKKVLEQSRKEHQKETKKLIAIGVDGKSGPVRIANSRTKIEDKVTFTNSVEDKYIDHRVPKSGSSQDNFVCTKSVLEKYESLESVTTINCDGCPVNTGNKGGLIALLEKDLKKPLQHAVCSLHCLEKILEHFTKDIGKFYFSYF